MGIFDGIERRSEWRPLSQVRKGDVCDDGSVITSEPVRLASGAGVYAVRDTDGVTHTDTWSWDDELRMRVRQ